MNYRFPYRFLMGLCLLSLAFVTRADTVVPASVAPASETFTLSQLSKIDTAVLSGNRPSYTFYIPIPGQWQVDSLDLNLVIQFSPLLLNTSSLTLMIDDVPLDTIKLDKANPQPVFWKLRIPREHINKKVTTVRLIGFMKLSDDVCRDIENQGNWITLSGNSSVTYHYQNNNTGLSLVDFPYPFVHKDAPYVDKIAFVLPEKTGADEFASYFKLANILSKEASWRGVTFETRGFSDFSTSTQVYPTIIAATPDTIDFSTLDKPETLQLKDRHWVQADGKLLADDVGVLWLTSRNQQPLLLISANAKQGLSTAIASINSNMMHFTTVNPKMFLAQPGQISLDQAAPGSTVRFSELGYKDSVVFGTGQNQLNYNFNLPVQYSNNPVKLVLNYSHSPFLQKDKTSSLSVSLNGLPLSGVELVPASAQRESFSITLPQKQLKPGKNMLTVTFNLLLSEAFCSRDYLSQAWGTIYDNSYLSYEASTQAPADQIKSYSDRMTGDVLVILPDDPQVYQNKSLVGGMIRFAGTLDQSSSITVQGNQAVQDGAESKNMVYLGTGNDHSAILDSLEGTFTQLVNNLNVTSNNNLKSIDKSIFMKAFNTNQDIGFVGIKTSPGVSQTAQLTLFGHSPQELGLAVTLLNDAYKRTLLSGNLAVAFQNGTFTSLSTDEIQENVQTEVAVERASRMTVNYILYGLGAAVLLILVFFGWRTWRSRKAA